jgi:hypothetical protein
MGFVSPWLRNCSRCKKAKPVKGGSNPRTGKFVCADCKEALTASKSERKINPDTGSRTGQSL